MAEKDDDLSINLKTHIPRLPEWYIDYGPPPEEISHADLEWRPQGHPWKSSNEWWCVWVPYLKASTVASMMSGWIKPGLWRAKYQETSVDGKSALECRIEIYNGLEWVAYYNVGNATAIEAVKGAYSDAFKRTATMTIGVGRDVYKLPNIKAPCRVREKDGKTYINGPVNDTDRVIRNVLVGMEIHLSEIRAVDSDGNSSESEEDEFRRTRELEAGPPVSGPQETPESRPAPNTAGEPSSGRREANSGASGGVVAELMSKLKGAPAQDAMKALKKANLWPVGKLEGDDAAKAVEILTTFVQAAGVDE